MDATTGEEKVNQETKPRPHLAKIDNERMDIDMIKMGLAEVKTFLKEKNEIGPATKFYQLFEMIRFFLPVGRIYVQTKITKHELLLAKCSDYSDKEHHRIKIGRYQLAMEAYGEVSDLAKEFSALLQDQVRREMVASVTSSEPSFQPSNLLSNMSNISNNIIPNNKI